MTRIVADFAGLAEFERAATRAIDQLEQMLADLRRPVAQIGDTWVGRDSDAYLRCQRQWDQASADLRDSLTELHRIVATARGNYSAAVRANLSMWRRR